MSDFFRLFAVSDIEPPEVEVIHCNADGSYTISISYKVYSFCLCSFPFSFLLLMCHVNETCMIYGSKPMTAI